MATNSIENDIPLLCDPCLGPNTTTRMLKVPNGNECGVCKRVFTSLRWQPGPGNRYKRTMICKTCAKAKNVCQACILDLATSLPVQVRDSFLDPSQVVQIPAGLEARQEYMNKMDANSTHGVDDALSKIYSGIHSNHSIQTLSRAGNVSNYNRNKAKVCTFWLRGQCSRGELCPYLHENIKHDPALAKQRLQDRYYGNNDAVAEKMLNKITGGRGGIKILDNPPPPPSDEAITTLYVDMSRIDRTVQETYRQTHPEAPKDTFPITIDDIRAIFIPYGDIDTVKILESKKGQLNQSSSSSRSGHSTHVDDDTTTNTTTTLVSGSIGSDNTTVNSDNGSTTNHPMLTFHKPMFALVVYTSRAEAESAMNILFNGISIAGVYCRVTWSNAQYINHSKQQQINNHKSVPLPPTLSNHYRQQQHNNNNNNNGSASNGNKKNQQYNTTNTPTTTTTNQSWAPPVITSGPVAQYGSIPMIMGYSVPPPPPPSVVLGQVPPPPPPSPPQ